MSILSIINLNKAYKDHKVLNEINLTIDKAGIWALVGPNGSGKTTFLNVVTNLIPATSGNVNLLGRSNKDYNVFKSVSFLQDNTILFDYLNGYDHLKYICDIHKIDKKRIKEVAEYVGMERYLKKNVGNYSLGMKQHLLLAMAIINKPKLLFLDEPLNGLDPTSAILMRGILLELAERGTTIILSSHNLMEIDKVTKKILFLKDGRLIEEDMSYHEKITYHLYLNNSKKGKQVLLEKGYQVELFDNVVIIQLQNNLHLQSVLNILQEYQLDIVDIQKEVAGSEKRYEEIFGV